jgi:hypothetical protein
VAKKNKVSPKEIPIIQSVENCPMLVCANPWGGSKVERKSVRLDGYLTGCKSCHYKIKITKKAVICGYEPETEDKQEVAPSSWTPHDG